MPTAENCGHYDIFIPALESRYTIFSISPTQFMQLTDYSDYSLRVLTYLGLKGEKLATISEIAECYDISRNHIVKVVHRLGQLGYIETLRGKNGGLRLARSPEAINVGEVIRHMEASMDIVECFGKNNLCIISPNCVLRTAMNEALSAFLAVLDGYTLADLLAPQRHLWKRLSHTLVPNDSHLGMPDKQKQPSGKC